MPSLAAAALADAKFISIRSFKKDGQPVDTPVWFALLDDRIVVFTDGTSYKVKRIRREPRVEVARCDMRGTLLGPWQSGKCRAVESEPDLIKRAYAALNRKYGWMMRISTFFSSLARRVGRRLILEIALDA